MYTTYAYIYIYIEIYVKFCTKKFSLVLPSIFYKNRTITTYHTLFKRIYDIKLSIAVFYTRSETGKLTLGVFYTNVRS